MSPTERPGPSEAGRDGRPATAPARRGRTRRRLVCKVGGSLLDAGRAPAVLEVLARAARPHQPVLLAGGGRAVDRLRELHARGEVSEREAHWAAVRVLDVTALRLAGGCGRDLPVVTHLPPVTSGISVLAPRALLRSEDPMPHAWGVTSDSIAAWCALRLEAADLLLLKSRDGADRPPGREPRRRSVDRASEEGIVDEHLPSLLGGASRSPRAWILNGRHPARLLRWLTGDSGAATRLVPEE